MSLSAIQLIEKYQQKLRKAEVIYSMLKKAVKIQNSEKFLSDDYELDMWIHIESIEAAIENIVMSLIKARQKHVADLEELRITVELSVAQSSEIFDFERNLTQVLYSRLHEIDDLIEAEENEIQKLDDQYELLR